MPKIKDWGINKLKRAKSIIGKHWFFPLVLLLLLPYLIILFTNAYVVGGGDEAWQLQAAVRLVHGQGYTAHSFVPSNNLPDSEYVYLTRWPIGYSLLLSLFLRMGLTLDLSAKILKLSFLILGLALWLKLFSFIVKRGLVRVVFISFLCVISLRYVNSPTDFIIWAIFPLFSLIMLSIKEKEKPEPKSEITLIFYASLLASLLILIKYLGVVFILCGSLWILIIYKNNFIKMINRATCFIFLPLLTLLGILLTNKAQSGSTLTPSFYALFNNIHLNYQLYLSEFSLAFLYRLMPETFVIYISHLVGPIINRTVFFNGISLLFIVGISYILLVLYKERRTKMIVIWYLCVLISIIILFEGMTFILGYGRCDVAFTTSRYISFLGPFVIIFLLIYFRQSQLFAFLRRKISVRIMVVFVLLFCAVSASIYSICLDQKFKHSAQQKRFVFNEINNIMSSDTDVPIVVIAAGLPNTMFVQRGFPVFSNINQVLNDQAYFTKPTWVIVACEKNTDWPDEYARTVNRYKFDKVEDTYAVLWWKKFKTGHLKDETGGHN